jgi:hypothetical protein
MGILPRIGPQALVVGPAPAAADTAEATSAQNFTDATAGTSCLDE